MVENQHDLPSKNKKDDVVTPEQQALNSAQPDRQSVAPAGEEQAKGSGHPQKDKPKQSVHQQQADKERRKEEKRHIKAEKKKQKIRRKRAQIERYMSRPLYQRMLIKTGRWLAKMIFVLVCFIVAIIVGLMVGMGVVGGGNPMEALDPDVWRHIYQLVFPD